MYLFYLYLARHLMSKDIITHLSENKSQILKVTIFSNNIF